MYIVDLESSEVTLVDKFELTDDSVLTGRRQVDMDTSDSPMNSREVEKRESYRDEDM